MTPRTMYIAAHAALGFVTIVTQFVLLPVIVQMLLYTGAILYISSHHSLAMFEKDPETGEHPEVESVSRKDAMLFPIVGSGALFSMYVAYKFFGKYWVNLLLTTYLTVIGLVALAESLRPVLAPLLPEEMQKRSTKLEFRIPFLQKPTDEPLKLSFGKVDVLGYVLSAALAGVYLYTKYWPIHNLFAISFCLQAVAMISLGRFHVAFILLTGLFFYDIFWVFGTEVMVSVATSFTGPIKIIFPVSWDPWKQSILGLGDIVIPGIFVAMCLRFDAYLYRSSKANGETDAAKVQALEVLDYNSDFPKTYFWSVYVAYLVALFTTGVIMFGFDRAQPALLYLVPGTTLTLVGCSLYWGQFRAMVAYNEEDLVPKKATEAAAEAQGPGESDKDK